MMFGRLRAGGAWMSESVLSSALVAASSHLAPYLASTAGRCVRCLLFALLYLIEAIRYDVSEQRNKIL